MTPASAAPIAVRASPRSGARVSTSGRDELEAIADALLVDGDHFIDSLYARFFDRCPEARPLFGEHSLSEREEMVSESFRAIVAWLDDEPWLEANLIAFGESHVEYGVRGEMYPPFVDAFVETVCACTAEPSASPGIQLLREGLEEITRAMATRSSLVTRSRP